MNESFKYSIQKPSQIFISDVFDLFELDFDELIKKVHLAIYEALFSKEFLKVFVLFRVKCLMKSL